MHAQSFDEAPCGEEERQSEACEEMLANDEVRPYEDHDAAEQIASLCRTHRELMECVVKLTPSIKR